jgi:SAM-dependent methyltransferase
MSTATGLSKNTPFKAEMDTPPKRLARLAVYSEVRRQILLHYKNPDPRAPARYIERDGKLPFDTRVLLFPGRLPSHEIGLAKHLLNAYVIAVDTDQQAVDAARESGADHAQLLDLSDLKIRLRRKYPGDTSPIIDAFDFVNMDTCGLVTTDGVSEAFERACKIGVFVATWFSFGHEMKLSWVHERALLRLKQDPAMERRFQDIPSTIKCRLLFARDQANLSERRQDTGLVDHVLNFHIVKIWSYRSNAMPMFVVLWADGQYVHLADDYVIPFERISADDYRSLVMRAVDAESSNRAVLLYGCSKAQVAAWRAVRTTQTKKRIGP